MSDASWIKIKSALPRPTSEEHTRPLRLFAPGYAGEPYLSAHTYGRAIDYKPIKPVTEFCGERVIGFDTPEANERFWEAAREQFGDESVDEENDATESTDGYLCDP